MDADKLRGITVGSLITKAQDLAEQMAPDEPDYAEELALALVKSLIGDGDLNQTVGLFGDDKAISDGLFGAEEPVTVTQTTTSVGGLPEGDTPEESPEEQELMNRIQNATSEEELDQILAENGYDDAAGTSEEKPAEEPKEPKEEKPAEKPTEEKKPAAEPKEPKEEKPAEEPKKEEPKEPKEEPKEDKPESKKEDKQEQSDTDRNIIGTLADLK